MQIGAASSTVKDDRAIHSQSRGYLPNEVHFNSVYSPNQYRLLAPVVDSRFRMEKQDLINRNALFFTRLREAAREVESLRLENAALRSANRELSDHLSCLIQASVQNHCLSAEYDKTPLEILNDFDKLYNISGNGGDEVCDDESPTSVIDVQNGETSERTSLPKSISVRSNGYVKLGEASAKKTRGVTRPKTCPLKTAQKVYVPGGKMEEEPLELEVYNQGMFKTELCNKWQETGDCPYGEHCQFAHGIKELRPVIRHPRYKTEVCRMVLAGDICPYGHRCHFRHVLMEHEVFKPGQ
ncbi:zinc finger CCCH domain-containing protein 15 [Euphorbia lathyris]|uniref:zinc finger CCCH domain-containing protein 15 n=1 Tax=Euphorbia lathyris TaxID=212925 RepID=UPI00331320FF